MPRIVDGLPDELLVSFAAISLVGPRAAGKTTRAVRRGGTVLRLDQPEVRQSVAASPDAMLAGLRPPVILDEWQEVPELLGAVKRSVDQDPAPGRYILTGSVRAGIAAESRLWSAAGINAKTAQAYQALFQRMFVLDLVPAWFSTRIKRLIKAPKRATWSTRRLSRPSSGSAGRPSCTALTCWAASSTPS